MKRPTSSHARKQRRFLHKAPLHLKRKHLTLHISKEARKKAGVEQKRVLAKSGMRIRIIKGKYKGKEGTISRASIKKSKLYIEGISQRNARGREKLICISPCNVVIIDNKIKEYLTHGEKIKRVGKKKEETQADENKREPETNKEIKQKSAEGKQVTAEGPEGQ